MLRSKSLSAYRGRSVLITGGVGFIGGNLFNIKDIKERVVLHVADVGDKSTIGHLVGGVDFIFNLAGNVSHLDSMTSPEWDMESNCRAQLSLLEACRRFNPHVRIVYSSTRQVYGKPVYLPFDEQHRCAPVDINGVHKLAAEHYHLLYDRIYGLRSTCVRLTNTYGPRQLILHNRQGVIAWFI